jgi:D-threonate/D-erythronate kinase
MDHSRWALLADDITGACDSAAEFARVGFGVYFWLNTGCPPPPETGFLALSSDSRECDEQTARELVVSRCRLLQDSGYRILLKKVDSALRGHWVAELEAVAHACGRSEVFISPTLPAFGRSLAGGRVRLPPGSNLPEIDALAMLRSAVQNHATSLTLSELWEGKWRFNVPEPRSLLIDTESASDLSELAAYALQSAPDGLLAGSAGLAAALAAQLGEPRDEPYGPAKGGPVVYWIGSVHPACLRQVAKLLDEVEPSRRQVVPVEFRPDEDRHIRLAAEELASRNPRAFVITGGETAALVLRALDVEGIRLRGLIRPGIPWGTLVGGVFDGLAVVTKSGSFGGPDSLVEVDRFLNGK